MQDLTRGIDKIFGRTEKKAEKTIEKVIVQQGGNDANVAPLLERAFMFLEDGEWKDANVYCEKVLDIDPKNAEAYLGKLMAELCVKKQKKLKNCAEPFEKNNNYKKAIKFGTNDLANGLKSANDYIIKRNEQARIESIYDQASNVMKAADSEEKYKKAAKLFGKIPEYKDSKKRQKDCLEKADEAKQRCIEREKEAEDVYNQLIEALKNNGKTETTESHLEDAENKKQELERTLDEQLRKFETDKSSVRSKASSLNRKRNELQSLDLKKQEVDRKISDLEKQISSLGIFAISKKKELNQEIENLSAEKLKLLGDIDELQKEVSSVMVTLEALGSEADIDNKAEALKQDFKVKIQTTDNEIERLKQKLEEEKTSAKRKFSLLEILNELTTKKYISQYITRDSQKINALKQYSNLSLTLCFLFGLPFSFGSYPQGKNGERAPIEWIVLAKKSEKALVVSKYALDCQKYNSTDKSITWEKCSLRTWMNGTFFNNAFSADEQAKIATTTVSADKNPLCSTYPGNATMDKVFLLSITEAKKYLTTDESRKCAPAYAKAQGADSDKTASGEAKCWWWLRSPGRTQSDVASVSSDGSVNVYGHTVNYITGAVRPALWINLES